MSGSHEANQPVELESQFIMRIPELPGSVLREALRNGAVNLKDRLKLKMENDMRHGTLYLDHFVLPSKLVDLPCVIESMKTIDRKNVYKTADICQMLICMEEEEPEEEPKPQKKKDGFKVEKKYLYPHGITPPLKNVRKRRFRRTLKKKQYNDQPEVEKEVRRLFRMDYEASQLSWEVIDEEEDKTREGGGKDVLMQGSKTNEEPPTSGASHRMAVADLFGDASSDSDVDDDTLHLTGEGEIEEDSRLSNELEDTGSHMSDSMASYSVGETPKDRKSSSSYVTSFTQDMFPSTSSMQSSGSPEKSPRRSKSRHSSASGSGFTSYTKEELQSQLDELQQQLTEINARRQIQETELSSLNNVVFRQRLEGILNKLINDQLEKETQIDEVKALLAEHNDN